MQVTERPHENSDAPPLHIKYITGQVHVKNARRVPIDWKPPKVDDAKATVPTHFRDEVKLNQPTTLKHETDDELPS